MTAPAWLARAAETALARTLVHAEVAGASMERFDYAVATRALARASHRGLAAAFLGWLVSALGGPPRRHRYPSRAARIEAKRERTRSVMRRNAWLARGGDA